MYTKENIEAHPQFKITTKALKKKFPYIKGMILKEDQPFNDISRRLWFVNLIINPWEFCELNPEYGVSWYIRPDKVGEYQSSSGLAVLLTPIENNSAETTISLSSDAGNRFWRKMRDLEEDHERFMHMIGQSGTLPDEFRFTDGKKLAITGYIPTTE